MSYERRPGVMHADLANAREFEAQVKAVLPSWHIDETASTSRLDWWVPGWFLDAKEKRQALNKRWHLLDGVDEVDLVVLDELGIRKALEHGPSAYFIIRDVPGGNRLFLVGAWELACLRRARVDRVGKGKAIFDLRDMRQLRSLDEIVPTIMADLASTAWRQSNCVSQQQVGQV